VKAISRSQSNDGCGAHSASLDQSLQRMGLDYVDIFYSHRPDPETPIEETMGALATAVGSGRTLYVGISNYNPEQTRLRQRVDAERR
jgi:L-glyceraldehyde 3-phosphate reductase